MDSNILSKCFLISDEELITKFGAKSSDLVIIKKKINIKYNNSNNSELDCKYKFKTLYSVMFKDNK